MKGLAILFVGVPLVTCVFNIDFSLEEDACFEEGSFVDEVFSVVIEQKHFTSLWRLGSGLGVLCTN